MMFMQYVVVVIIVYRIPNKLTYVLPSEVPVCDCLFLCAD